ncbi:MAG TPA: sigma 54-interacting transcriptional regulator [Candidatus Binatia bacterium]|jgi:DNA-binding NtrC family response regulator
MQNDRAHLEALVGESECFRTAVQKIAVFANSDATVLISGETGTGKELFARAIHYQGPRKDKPFIPVNCGALPDHLLENELFGHERGAFTDASSAEKGLIAEAEGGTLLLDEIDTLSPAAQVKLLRFLQSGEYRPLGCARSMLAQVRVIAATNADLRQRMELKVLRQDLYYRLNTLALYIPPLRERVGDVPRLTAYFLTRYATQYGRNVPQLPGEVLGKLMTHSWPGNVRELECAVQRAVTLNTSQTLRHEDFDLPVSAAAALSEPAPLREAKTRAVAEFERSYLTNILVTCHGNITQAAKAAGKERRTFQRLVRKYGLERQSFQI